MWNEEKNISLLVKSIVDVDLPHKGMHELILVNNGSTDQTEFIIAEMARKYSWITPVQIKSNLNYGGGIYEGCKYATCDIFCYIPGDLQVMPNDVLNVFTKFLEHRDKQTTLFIKGFRSTRYDPWQTRITSKIYTFLANKILNLNMKDVNGLPKMFHRSLLDQLPYERMKTFVFDSQLLSIARVNKWTIIEIPVTFHSRREGVSSWSKKRIYTYIKSLVQLFRLRSLIGATKDPIKYFRH